MVGKLKQLQIGGNIPMRLFTCIFALIVSTEGFCQMPSDSNYFVLNFTSNNDSNVIIVDSILNNKKMHSIKKADIFLKKGVFPSNFYKLSWLQELYISTDSTVLVTNELSLFLNLDKIVVQGNKDGVCFSPRIKLPRLKSFRMEFSKDFEFPFFLKNCDSLQYIAIVNGNLSQIPSFIGKFSQLEYLILENNKLTKIPDEIFLLKKLKSLFLNGNLIRNVPTFLCDLPFLVHLHIQQNPLEDSIPSCIISKKNIDVWYDKK